MKKIITSAILALTGIFGASAATTAPSYPGGEAALASYISDNLQYPASAKENGIEGVVSVMFMVKSDGSIGNIKIVRMVDPDLESEAIRLVKGMPKWTPASNDGTPVDNEASIDVKFTID